MKNIFNILYVVGSGPNEAETFKRAVDLADANQAKLTVVGVFDDISRLKSSMPIAEKLIEDIVKQKYREIQELVNSVSGHHLKIEIKVFTGRAFIDVIQEVIRFKRDLLIKTIEKNENFTDTLFGNTDIKLLRNCPCPVWLLKSAEQVGDKEIVVALDYDPDNPENNALNTQMLTLAGSLAIAEFSELHVVHAWRLEHEAILRSYRSRYSKTDVDLMVKEERLKRSEWLKNIVAKSLSKVSKEASSYLKPVLHLEEGSASKVVPELATKIGAELMVMGTIGRSGISGYLIGNTAENILNQIKCSVLAVKPKDFVCPVKLV